MKIGTGKIEKNPFNKHVIGELYKDSFFKNFFLVVYDESSNQFSLVDMKTGHIEDWYDSLEEIDEKYDDHILVNSEIVIEE